MLYNITHTTNYYYSNSVSLCHNLTHLAARSSPWQTCVRSELELSSHPAVSITRTDYFGNVVTFFTVQQPHRKLEITAINEVKVHPRPTPDPAGTMPWEQAAHFLQTHRDPEGLDAYQFVFDSHYIKRHPALTAYAAESFVPGRPLLDAVLDLVRRIYTEFIFDSGTNSFDTPPHELLQIRRGVCQDFAHFQIGCLRSIGLPARYVSGYLLTNPPPGQDRLIRADMSHAWVSVFCPGFGWIDVDPTNNLITQEKHITLAWGRDYDDVSPIKGVILGGGRHSVSVGVDVRVAKEAQPAAAAATAAAAAAVAVGTPEVPPETKAEVRSPDPAASKSSAQPNSTTVKALKGPEKSTDAR